MLRCSSKVGIIVAHPDDETLWTGGTILIHPLWKCRIFSLCRGNDWERSEKFKQVLTLLGATGGMSDLDDGPDQKPLEEAIVQEKILDLIGNDAYDILITHGPKGEYTKHRRHEEISRVVINLWKMDRIHTRQLWLFAYEDGNRTYLPRPEKSADLLFYLPRKVWEKKYRIITETYGFLKESWEAQVTPKKEAFWCFASPSDLEAWLNKEGIKV